MKLYKDLALTQEITGTNIDLGRLEAGETKRFSFWVYNDTTAEYEDLVFQIGHPEVKIVSAPTFLSAHGTQELIIEWSPSITVEEGLNAPLNITGKKVFKP